MTTQVAEREEAPESHGPLGRRALIVCDNATASALLEEYLTRWGLEYTSVASMFDAFELMERSMMEQRPFEVALIDAKVDGGSGVELARSIAKSAVPIPLALLTEGAAVEGASGRVTTDVPRLAKPIRESDLYDFLMNAFHLGTERVGQTARRGLSARPELSGHVLVVDDNEINQTVAVELLTELGLTADVANNGLEAFEATQRRAYDAVLMDCQMPIMDGYRAAREIRRWEQEHGSRRLPVIALTAHAIAGERDKVISAGMDDYLTKPIMRSQLESTLSRFVRRRATGEISVGSTRNLTETPRPANDVVQSTADEALLDPAVRRSDKLKRLFLELVPGQLEKLVAAIHATNYEDARSLAHKLKGSCASLGAREMSSICETLQHDAETRALTGALERCEKLSVLLSRVAAVLERELAQGAKTQAS
jgi:two-component system, sensor histidine kinase and response regulator